MAKYNPESKTWCHIANPAKDFVRMGSFLGESIFQGFAEANPEQIAEINGDTKEIFAIKNIHQGTITVAKNLQELGAGSDDRILIFCRINSHISSIVYACYTLGISFCPIDVMSCEYSVNLNFLRIT